MVTAESIYSILGGEPKANGGYMCHCPAHDDKTPSLSVDDGKNGLTLVKCMAGCSQEAVIEALKARVAWYDTKGGSTHTESRKPVQTTSEEREKRARAKANAAGILENAKGDPAKHPYAKEKGLSLGDMAKRGAWPQRVWKDALLFPLFSSDRSLASVQAINVDGTKDFLSGGQTKGCFYPVGQISEASGFVVIGEGVATVAAVCESMGCSGVAAMTAGNLDPVAKEIKKLSPNAEIVIIGDDDQKPDGSNPGRDAATKAAAAIGCKMAIPALEKKADAWDAWHEQGTDGIKAMMAAAGGNEWPTPEPLISHTDSTPYPIEALPPIIREAVEEVVNFVKCPVALAACSALSVVASVSQAFADIRRDTKLEGPIGLYLLSIGDSGERKSTVDNLFSSSIIAWEEEVREAYTPMKKRYKAQFDAWDAEKSGLLTLIKDRGKKELCTKAAYEKPESVAQ